MLLTCCKVKSQYGSVLFVTSVAVLNKNWSIPVLGYLMCLFFCPVQQNRSSADILKGP